MPSEKEVLGRVQGALFHLRTGVAPFVETRLTARYGANWRQYVNQARGAAPEAGLDAHALLKTIRDNWRTAFEDAFPQNARQRVRSFLTLALEARNITSHLSAPLEDADALRYLDAIHQLLKAVNAPFDDIDEVRRIYDAQRHSLHASTEQTAVQPEALADLGQRVSERSDISSKFPHVLPSNSSNLFTPGKRARVYEDAILDLTAPERFHQAHGPQWHAYADALKLLDAFWRDRRHGNASFGVFGPRPSWEDTIARGEVVFDVESWAVLDEEQASMIAPTHFFADGDALLGSVGRRSKDVRDFLFGPEMAGERDHILSLLKQARQLPASKIPTSGGDILAEMCKVRGMGKSFGTRLLALARPDGFVVVNNKSLQWLRLASGFSLAGKRRSYRSLLEWVHRQEWYQAGEPSEFLDRRLWRIRAALLDAFAYRP